MGSQSGSQTDVALADVHRKASLFDLITESAPDAIVSVDEEGVIRSFSPAAEEMFGYHESDVLGRPVTVLMPEPYRSEHDGYMSRYMTTGVPHIIGIGREVRAQRKSGEVFPAELAIGELVRGGETVFMGFIRDVSDRAKAEKEAARLKRALDRVSRIQTLGEMSTAVAHEVNQPLTAIANYATAARRLLKADGDHIDEAAALLDQVTAEARRAGEIIKRMRNLVDRGAIELRPENVNSIVRDATRLSVAGLPYNGLDVHQHLDENLPPVMADRVQIQQVVINLLANSIEAIGGDEHHDVHVETERVQPSGVLNIAARRNADDAVMVTVRDDGPGIPDEALGSIFEPFYSKKTHGLGVGLAVCRSIVHAHGGKIWAENNSDGGASFHFTLRAADASGGVAEEESA